MFDVPVQIGLNRPRHEEAKKYISGRIEEMKQEEIFVKKLIRQRVEGG